LLAALDRQNPVPVRVYKGLNSRLAGGCMGFTELRAIVHFVFGIVFYLFYLRFAHKGSDKSDIAFIASVIWLATI